MCMCVCVCALSKTMTILSEVLTDFEAKQLPGYQSLFLELQFACIQLQFAYICIYSLSPCAPYTARLKENAVYY